MILLISELEEVISKALLELKNAEEYDNNLCLEVYVNSGEQKLKYHLTQKNITITGINVLYTIKYTFPYYNNDPTGSKKYMVESGIKEENCTNETIKDWDWNMYMEDEYFNVLDMHVHDAINEIKNYSSICIV
jgi:hypothetical protein